MAQFDWRPCFPHESPRDQQVQALDFITQQFLAGKEFVIAELGTGVGKSAIAITLSNWLRTYATELVTAGVILPDPQAYVLTSQKILQDQYARDFSAVTRDLRSSANFSCKWIEGQTCAETMRIERALKQSRVVNYIGCNDVCPYRASKQEFLEAQTGITNYSYFLSETVYAGALGVRELIIFDESHHIEDEMRRWSTTSISRNVAVKLLHLRFPQRNTDARSVVRWIEAEYAPAARRLLEKLLGSIRSKVSKRAHVLSPDIVHELARRYEWLDKHVCQMNRYIDAPEEEKKNYLVERDFGSDDDRINLKPLDVKPYVRDLLFSRGRKKLLMSATILDEATFKRNNGVPSDARTASMCIPTPFNPDSFGITFEPVGKMSRKHIDSSINAAVTKIKEILDKHPNDKGVIHCLDGFTLITTPFGQRRLVDINAGERVTTWNEQKQRFELQTVVKRHDNGLKECVQLTFENGKTLICTLDHKILTRNRGWVGAIDITENDDVIEYMNDTCMST